MVVFIVVLPAARDGTATDEKDDHYDQANEEFVHGNRLEGLAGPRVMCHALGHALYPRPAVPKRQKGVVV